MLKLYWIWCEKEDGGSIYFFKYRQPSNCIQFTSVDIENIITTATIARYILCKIWFSILLCFTVPYLLTTINIKLSANCFGAVVVVGFFGYLSCSFGKKIEKRKENNTKQ